MKDIELIKEFSSRTTKIINKIKSYGDNVFYKRVVEKILRSLIQKFEHIVVVIEETKDLLRLTIHELMGSLEAYEQRVN
jgi:histone H3/H4